MIVQISYLPEESYAKDLNKSFSINLTISGIIQQQMEKLSNICSFHKIKLDTFNKTIPARNYLAFPENQLDELIKGLIEAGLQEISNKIKKAAENYKNYDQLPVKCGDTEFNEPVVMGILNVTPDSFSDGNKYLNKNTAVEYAVEMIENGADIIDIGGESTRPGSDPVSEEEEFNRVIPVVEEIIKKKPDALISIDTTKSKIAEEACKRGVKIINDISGLTFDPEIADVAFKYSASLIIMHIKGTPKTMQVNPLYNDLIFEIYEFLYNQAEAAKKAGVKNIFIDPGIGFGKKIEHNFEILKRLPDFKCLGYPILIGLSRKSFLGKALDLDIKDRDTVTVAAETIALRNGAKIIRTHNVLNAVKTKKLLKLIYTE